MYSPASDSSSSPSSTSSYSDWSPSSTRSSPVHAASLVDPANHSPELMQLVDTKLSRPVIEYVVDCVSETVDYALGRSSPSGELAARGRSTHSTYRQKFTSFVSLVLSRAEVAPATVLVALVYVARARPHLSIALEEWALERVFLGALITASKYTNDSTLKNVHWALCTGVFGKRDVGRIEREFLDVLDWELAVSEADLLAHHEGIAVASGAAHRAHFPAKSAPAPAPAHHLAVPVSRPRAHTHHRRVSAGAVPELEPSSPLSSAGSLSPRTPVSHAESPSGGAHPHRKDAADVPMDVDAPFSPAPVSVSAHSKNASAGGGRGRLHDLLHAFPIPIPRAHHNHHRHHHALEIAA
ncbi:hypothetical protein B0H11DRAFT_2200889, partial [Mycena galericulata]